MRRTTLRNNLRNSVKPTQNLSGSGIFNDLVNAIPAADNTARPRFPGENHMLLKLPNGRTGIGNFMGPGTQVYKRVKRGDIGRVPSDSVAKLHDINYRLAQNSKSKKEQYQKVRKADKRMVKKLKEINRERGDSQRNIQAGMRLIQMKLRLQSMGLMGKQRFAGQLERVPREEVKVLEEAKEKLQQQGYGKEGEEKVYLPGELLKKKLLQKLSKQKKAKVKKSQSGMGVDLVGKIMSVLEKELKLKIPIKIKELVKQKAKTPEQLSKILFPILTSLYATKKKVDPKAVLGAIPSKKKNEVVAKLSKDIKGVVVKKGSGQVGTGFWKSFAKGVVKGFKMVVKPALKVASIVAPLTGTPQGVLLGVASNIVGKRL